MHLLDIQNNRKHAKKEANWNLLCGVQALAEKFIQALVHDDPMSSITRER